MPTSVDAPDYYRQEYTRFAEAAKAGDTAELEQSAVNVSWLAGAQNPIALMVRFSTLKEVLPQAPEPETALYAETFTRQRERFWAMLSLNDDGWEQYIKLYGPADQTESAALENYRRGIKALPLPVQSFVRELTFLEDAGHALLRDLVDGKLEELLLDGAIDAGQASTIVKNFELYGSRYFPPGLLQEV